MTKDKVREILALLQIPENKKFEILLYCPTCLWKKFDNYNVKPMCPTCGRNVRVISDYEVK
jgi:hypothetical protein